MNDRQSLCGMAVWAGGRPVAAANRVRTVQLRRGEVRRFEKGSRIRSVSVSGGVVWLTATPGTADVLLRAGEQFDLPDQWPYVVEALEAVELVCFLR